MSIEKPFILQLSTCDLGGGAERIARTLFHAYRERGLGSYLAVKARRSRDSDVLDMMDLSRTVVPWQRRLAAKFARRVECRLGHEDFNFPATQYLLGSLPERPDIIHAHNLHGGYFDLRCLPCLSRQAPMMLTLHDAWMLSGHCAHSFDCERWKTGCGQCPNLDVYPAIRRDGTAFNWRRKRRLYKQARVYVSTPSDWLMRKVHDSILAPAIIESRVIPNGIDLGVFSPGDCLAARAALGIAPDARVLLCAANGIRKSRWKDWQTMRSTIALAGDQLKESLFFLALGEDAPPEQVGRAQVRFIPFQKTPERVALYYRAADVYLHAAKADTFPNTVLEALACGTPVVATAVGGIPEQVTDGETGFLAPMGDAAAMAFHVCRILQDQDLQAMMRSCAASVARQRFGLQRMVDDYLYWYQEISEQRCAIRR